MPKYEYACKSCGQHLDVVQSFNDDPLTECPACGGVLRKVFGNIGIAFKGSGFYRTDNRKRRQEPKVDAKADGAKADSKSDSGADAKAGDAKAGDSKSGDSKSGDSKSGDSKGGPARRESAPAADSKAKSSEAKTA
jgi:putative FmdB family regulatory protein